MNKINVLIADDHTLFRTGVRRVLEAEEDMTVVGEAATGREALELARTLTPDIILMDIKMPDPSANSGQALDGIEATRTLCREMPHIGIIFVTMFEDDEFILKGLQAGGRGYILKDSDPDTMLRAIRAVARGESLLGPTIAQKVLRQFTARPGKQSPPGGQLVANRFEINNLEKDLLGHGGMGDVYRATDLQTGATVAVKALSPDVLARDPGILERFVREGEALRQLNHPNIVKMLAAVEQDANARHYLVMEYVEGGSLQHLLAAQGPLPNTRVVEIALDLADALTRAHRLGIIHRDLKPANVLLAQDGTPRLADFGIAHVESGPRLTQTGVLMGTIDYLSPEVCQGQPPDERADIWALGVMLFEMLTGKLPFVGKSLPATLIAILTQPIPNLAQLAPGIPDALVDLIYHMLEKDRHQRIPSVRLVGAELEAILKGQKALT